MTKQPAQRSLSPWHEGERAVQERLGVRTLMDSIGPRLIRNHLPQQHQQFFAQLNMLLMAVEDESGYPWANPVFGEPGFVHSPNPATLRVSIDDSLNPLLVTADTGRAIGLLGIDLLTRRRNRLNGIIQSWKDGMLSVSVRQSFGNCKQYIRTRQAVPNPSSSTVSVTEFEHWDPRAVSLIKAADTFFIASSSGRSTNEDAYGLDISHRGGAPGFIDIDAQNRLLVPDYAGNNFFNTLGNIVLNSRTGLLFIDFAAGHICQLVTTAEILHHGLAQRTLRFTLVKGRFRENASAYLWCGDEA